MRPSTPPAPRHVRRWRVPPPLTRGSELLEGSAILAEVPGENGVLLWKTMRSTTLWAEAESAEMAGLFAPSAHPRRLAEVAVAPLEDALREPLETLVQPLADPHGTSAEVVALACRHIALWAEGRGAVGTALAFQQAAALVCPGEARHAYEVGRLARQGGEMARAESWYRRAIMLARQSGDWYSYSRAYLGVGNLLMQRGALPQARRVLTRGLRAARRHSLRPVAAMAYHDLLVVCIESADHRAARRFARAAFAAYTPQHARLPVLANDIACLWMEEGDFSRALPVVRETLKHVTAPTERAMVLGNTARAAGGCGDIEGFDLARDQLLAAAAVAGESAATAQALLNLARGSESLGRRGDARAEARRAWEMATRCGAGQVLFQAEAVIEAAERGSRAIVPASAPSCQPDAEEQEEFARQLVASLQRAAGPAA